MTPDRRLLVSSWHLVCHELEVADAGQYVLAQVGDGLEIAAWRDHDGRLVVFDNVCPHRGARIFALERDRGAALRCPYHGFSYSRGEEKLPGIVCDPTRAGVRRRSLRTLDFEIHRGLVFASFGAPRPWEESFSQDAKALIKATGEAMGAYWSTRRETWDAPWQCAVENALEAVHVPHVHPSSLGALGLRDARSRDLGGGCSVYSASIDQAVAARMRRMELADVADRDLDGVYSALYLFPFAMISTTNGFAYAVQRYAPEGRRTGFTTKVYAPARADVSRVGVSSYLAINHETNVRIFSEDRRMVERLSERGRRASYEPGFLVEGEEQVAWFREELHRRREKEGAG